MERILVEVENWLKDEYFNLNKRIFIKSVINKIENTMNVIVDNELYDKRFSISNNISIVVYKSLNFEVHISFKGEYSNYKLFQREKFYLVNDKDEMSESEIEELAYKLFVEEADETKDISRVILENEGFDGAVRLLQEYSNYTFIKIN